MVVAIIMVIIILMSLNIACGLLLLKREETIQSQKKEIESLEADIDYADQQCEEICVDNQQLDAENYELKKKLEKSEAELENFHINVITSLCQANNKDISSTEIYVLWCKAQGICPGDVNNILRYKEICDEIRGDHVLDIGVK